MNTTKKLIPNSATVPTAAMALNRDGVTLRMLRSTSLTHVAESLRIPTKALSMHRIAGTDSFTLWAQVGGRPTCVDAVSLRAVGLIANPDGHYLKP